ncbi:hypothetical protein B0H13DRAFT_2398277 [Mycena leptocephala]|nr:hypothetical protein B0H13DRAFT_2398277 [Mycena leptocephala]
MDDGYWLGTLQDHGTWGPSHRPATFDPDISSVGDGKFNLGLDELEAAEKLEKYIKPLTLSTGTKDMQQPFLCINIYTLAEQLLVNENSAPDFGSLLDLLTFDSDSECGYEGDSRVNEIAKLRRRQEAMHDSEMSSSFRHDDADVLKLARVEQLPVLTISFVTAKTIFGSVNISEGIFSFFLHGLKILPFRLVADYAHAHTQYLHSFTAGPNIDTMAGGMNRGGGRLNTDMPPLWHSCVDSGATVILLLPVLFAFHHVIWLEFKLTAEDDVEAFTPGGSSTLGKYHLSTSDLTPEMARRMRRRVSDARCSGADASTLGAAEQGSMAKIREAGASAKEDEVNCHRGEDSLQIDITSRAAQGSDSMRL